MADVLHDFPIKAPIARVFEAISMASGVLLAGLSPLPDRHVVGADPGPVAYVIAPSGSTRLEARRILRVCRWTDTTAVLDADFVLVVVRSSSSEPLAPSYDSLKWLWDAATSQLNESGAQFHIYLYSIRQELSFLRFLESSHRSYDVDVTGAITPLPATPYSPYPTGYGYPCG
jgi:hypothetical protein